MWKKTIDPVCSGHPFIHGVRVDWNLCTFAHCYSGYVKLNTLKCNLNTLFIFLMRTPVWQVGQVNLGVILSMFMTRNEMGLEKSQTMSHTKAFFHVPGFSDFFETFSGTGTKIYLFSLLVNLSMTPVCCVVCACVCVCKLREKVHS